MLFRKKLSCVNKLLSDIKEDKLFPSKSRFTSFNLNAGMLRIGLKKKKCDLFTTVCESRDCPS